MTIDESIKHAREVAEKKYAEGMLCHANPNDDLLEGCIQCAEEHEQIAEWLEELKELRNTTKKGGWIPCSERLPECNEDVLVCGDDGIFISYIEEKSQKWRYDTDEGIYWYPNVVAWMPLPEPYREERKC